MVARIFVVFLLFPQDTAIQNDAIAVEVSLYLLSRMVF